MRRSARSVRNGETNHPTVAWSEERKGRDVMPVSDGRPGALGGLRVLDLTTTRGGYCGKLFADLGADVVLVEPESGHVLRNRPPFAKASDQDEGPSLLFAYLHGNKRSITLDVEDPSGAATLRDLVAVADVLIEDGLPGRLEDLGLGYTDLRARNKRLVMVSITPFGQDGPYADRDAPDLVLLALGGLLSLGGYADGSPMQAPDEQAHMAGSIFGAVGGMMAVLAAENAGEGQHVDVSIQGAVGMTLENAAQFVDLEGHVRRGFGGTQRQAGAGVMPCADGFVFVLAGGIGGNRFWPNLLEWMESEDAVELERLRGDKWLDRAFLESDEAKQTFREVFGAFSNRFSKAELGDAAQRWRVPLAPCNSPKDIVGNAQLAHRGFFVPAQLDDTYAAISPGAPYRLSGTPWSSALQVRAVGENGSEVLADWGIDGLERSWM